MRLQEDFLAVRKSGVQKESKFKIEASTKAFKILSDNLYKDKIKAIIRELSCNAYDAHVEANNLSQTFDVHLPTYHEPYFYIRDYGTGLSQEQIENIYTTYFSSTKTNSNEFVGCLGLGSKSPFSYTDIFTITSYYSGELFAYTAFKEKGEPSIALLKTSNTDQPNGLKIEFAVNDFDFNNFLMKCYSLFPHFKMKPNFVGKQIEINDIDYMMKGDFWGTSREDKSMALMGNVAYPIDASLLKEELEDKYISFISSCSIHINFEIGELDIAPSREELSYDKNTIQNLCAKIVKVHTEINNKLSEEIDETNTLWEACILYNQIIQGDKVRYFINGFFDLQWKDAKVKRTIDIPKEYFSYNGREYFNMRSFARQGYTKKNKYYNTNICSITPCNAPDIKFLFIQGTATLESKIKSWLAETKEEEIFVINYVDGFKAYKLWEFLGFKEENILYAEEVFVKKPREKRQRNPVSRPHVIYELLVRSFMPNTYKISNTWNNHIIQNIKEVEGYYVPFDTYKVLDDNLEHQFDRQYFYELLQAATKYKLLENKIIWGIPKKDLKKVRKNPKLIPFKELINSIKKEWLKNRKYSSIIFPNHDKIYINRLCYLKGSSNIFTQLQEYYDMYTNHEVKPNEPSLLKYFGDDLVKNLPAYVAPDVWRIISDKYPLLVPFITNDYYLGVTNKQIDFFKDQANDYVELVDKQKGN